MGHFIYQLPLTNHRLTSLSIVGLPYVSSISDANMTIETVSASGSIGHRIFQAYFLPILVIFKSLKIHFSKPCPACHNFLSLRNIIHSSELLHISKLSQNILTRRSIYLQSDDAVGQHLARVLDDVNCRMIGGAIGGNFSRIKLIGNHLSRNTSTVSLKVNQQNGK